MSPLLPMVIPIMLIHSIFSDLWVSGSACGSSCSHGAQFNPSASSTFQNLSQPFAVQYGSGNVGGSLVSDTVQMAGFSVQNQPFGVVEEVQGDLLTSPISGLLGLAWQTIAATGKMPFWQTLVSSGAWTQPVMAFQLTRYVSRDLLGISDLLKVYQRYSCPYERTRGIVHHG